MIAQPDDHSETARSVEWSIATSAAYEATDVQCLLTALERENVEVGQRYELAAKSADVLPPAVEIGLYIAAGLGGGMLGAAGTDLWTKFKKVIGIAQKTEVDEQRPQVTATIEVDDRRFRLIVAGNDPEQVSRILDRALPKMDALAQSETLWYRWELDDWLTLDETLAWQDEQARREEDG